MGVLQAMLIAELWGGTGRGRSAGLSAAGPPRAVRPAGSARIVLRACWGIPGAPRLPRPNRMSTQPARTSIQDGLAFERPLLEMAQRIEELKKLSGLK